MRLLSASWHHSELANWTFPSPPLVNARDKIVLLFIRASNTSFDIENILHNHVEAAASDSSRYLTNKTYPCATIMPRRNKP